MERLDLGAPLCFFSFCILIFQMLPETFPLEVYDLSEFMDRHPGGPTTIVAWAGKDASKFFNEIHKGVKTLGAEAVYCMHSELQIFPCRSLFLFFHPFRLTTSPFFCRTFRNVQVVLWATRINSYLRPESHLGNLGVDGDLMSDEFWHTLREAKHLADSFDEDLSPI